MARNTALIVQALRAALPANMAVDDVTRIAQGRSNETYLVDGTDLVLRIRTDTPSLLIISAGLEEQYATLKELQEIDSGLPTPRVTYLGSRDGPLGVPFFLMERLPGNGWPDFAPPDWARGSSDAFGERVARSLAEIGAVLARTPPLVSVPTLNALEELERWERSVDAFADPSLRRSFRSLAKHPPRIARPALVHGDLRLGNVLWGGDGAALGLVDWELAFNGDPLWDLSWFLLCFDDLHPDGHPAQAVPGFWERQRFVDHWRQHGGIDVTALPWFEAAAACKAACVLLTGFHFWEQGLVADESYKELGPLVRKWLDLAAERVERAQARA